MFSFLNPLILGKGERLLKSLSPSNWSFDVDYGWSLLSDSAVLDDRTLLPVTGVRYGPMRFQLQKAKISVSKLQCQPYSSLSRFKCYTDSKYYKLVNGICYYYEKVKSQFSIRISTSILGEFLCHMICCTDKTLTGELKNRTR